MLYKSQRPDFCIFRNLWGRAILMKNLTRLFVVVTMLFLVIGFSDPLFAATYCANDFRDGPPNAGDCSTDGNCVTPPICSLRDAIVAANANPGLDTITIPAGTYTFVTQTFDLWENAGAKGDLDITGEVNINGAGPTNTIIDAARIDRVFDSFVVGGVVRIGGLTIRNGRTSELSGENSNGGGILSRSNLVLSDCAVDSNGANFVMGGGIMVEDGSLIVSNCTISRNLAVVGGGVATSSTRGGPITMTNSTVSGNSATEGGGGIFTGRQLSLYNVTITGNRADSDDSNGDYDFGGGFYRWGEEPILIRNSIIAGNYEKGVEGSAGETSPDYHQSVESVYSAQSGYNLVGKRGGGAEVFTGGTDRVGTIASPLDPRLGPLGSNGGSTQSHLLLAGSPAIDAGNPSGCLGVGDVALTTDQRGFNRMDGNNDGTVRCDIGAFEVGCGDGIRQEFAAEQCDDGRHGIVDGCSDRCQNQSLTMAVTSVTIAQGGRNDHVAMMIGRENFTGAVSISLGGTPPTGITVSSGSFEGNATFAVEVSPSVEPGSYPVDLRGQIESLRGKAMLTVTVAPASCSDGTIQSPEGCDDGNFLDGDGCDSNCTTSACGNGVPVPPEACDDGNRIDTDACTNACNLARCGDGIRRPDVEECDLGTSNNDRGACTSTCRNARCGDGFVQTGEQCDGGPTCNASCQTISTSTERTPETGGTTGTLSSSAATGSEPAGPALNNASTEETTTDESTAVGSTTDDETTLRETVTEETAATDNAAEGNTTNESTASPLNTDNGTTTSGETPIGGSNATNVPTRISTETPSPATTPRAGGGCGLITTK